LDITKPNINRAIAVKAFLDESTTLLVTNIFMIAALSDLPGSSQPGPFRPSILQNTAVFNILDDVNRIWENTRSFPDVLNHVLRALKIDLETLVKRLRTAAAATGHSSISTALTRFPDDKDVVNMWKNYEGFYIVSLNILLPKDNISLDKLIYDGLLEIGRSFIERYSDMMEDYSEMENTKQTIDQQYFTLNGLSQVVLDLQHGVYNRIIKWLVNIHKGVLSGQYSLFMPLIQLPK
jgi:hypothetical protein